MDSDLITILDPKQGELYLFWCLCKLVFHLGLIMQNMNHWFFAQFQEYFEQNEYEHISRWELLQKNV